MCSWQMGKSLFITITLTIITITITLTIITITITIIKWKQVEGYQSKSASRGEPMFIITIITMS